jgi:hypothetical protein
MALPDSNRAIALADRVLAAAEHADLVEVIAETLITRGASLVQLWRVREGLGAMRTGTQLAEEYGLTRTVVRGWMNEVGLLASLDPRAALDAGASAMALGRRLGQRGPVAFIAGLVGTAAYMTGDWDLATREIDSVLSGEPDESDLQQLLQPWIFIRASRGEDVTDEAARAMRWLELSGEHILETQVHDLRARLALAGGRLADARSEALASNAMEVFPDILYVAIRSSLWQRDLDGARADLAELNATGAHGPSIDAQRTVSEAGIAALSGDMAQALSLYREGRRALRERGVRFMLALSGIDMALLLPDEKETADAVAEAREILTELEARPFLDRLEQALRPSPAPSAMRSPAAV